MLKKTQLPCCAICFLSQTENDTTQEELNQFINQLKKEAFSKEWTYAERETGERSILTVTSPKEITLDETLKKVGFNLIEDTLQRRYGYVEGNLKLWVYKF